MVSVMVRKQALKVSSLIAEVFSDGERCYCALSICWRLDREPPEQDESKSKQTQRDRYDPERSIETLERWHQKDRGSVSGAHQFKYLFVRLALLNRVRELVFKASFGLTFRMRALLQNVPTTAAAPELCR
jgi:hypothetical protein